MKTKKICMAVTNNLKHDSRVKRVATSLSNHGFKVTIIALFDINDSTPPPHAEFQIVRINKQVPTNIWQQIRYYSPLLKFGNINQKNMYLAAVQQKADIYHANDFDTLQAIAKAAQKLGVPFAYDSHELFTATINQQNPQNSLTISLLRLYVKFFEKKYISKAAVVFTVNQSIANQLRNLYDIPLPTVLRNFPSLTKANSKFNFKKYYNLPETAKIVLYQGAFGIGRGIIPLINSCRFLPQNTYLIFLGYGDLLSEMNEKVSRENLRNVFFHPGVKSEDLLTYTRGADIGMVLIEGINLSKQYASPNKMYEYLAAGIPIIASDLLEISKFVNETKSGYIIKEITPKIIAGSIKKLLYDNNLEKMKIRAIKAYENKFNWNIEEKRLLRVYRKFID